MKSRQDIIKEPFMYVFSEQISPEKFLNLTIEDKIKIKDINILLPQLGQPGFGGIVVTYKFPVIKRKHARQHEPA